MALPNGYTRLEYIQSSGTQYIDTGYKANGNTRLIMDVQLTDASISNQWFYGGRDDLQVKAFGLFWINSAFALTFGTEQNTAVHTPSSANATKRMCIDHNKNTFSAPDFSYSFASQTFASNYNLFLLARNSGGTISMPIKARLYSCQIYDNNVLARDFVPCKNSSGVVGLYDTVNSEFYADAAGGTFTAGVEIIPSYKIVDGTMLDLGLSATADAIRAKTGNSADIAWSESGGFASAVSAISSGSKVVSGSIKPSSASSTLTVSGIGFTPKRILLYLAPSSSYMTFQHKAVLFVEGGERKYCLVMGDGASSYIFNRSSNVTVTMNSNGFTVNTNLTTAQFFISNPYNYVAIG